MGKFVKSLTIVKQCDDDAVSFVVQPMRRSTALKFRGLKKVPVMNGDVQAVDEKTNAPLFTLDEGSVETMISEFSEHVVSISGARDSDGSALDKDTVLGAAYFVTLVTQAASEWVAESQPGN